jgi:hypothetical protein
MSAGKFANNFYIANSNLQWPYQSPKHAPSYFNKTEIEITAFNEAMLGRCLVYQVTNMQNLFVCWFSWGDCNRCSVSLGDSLCRLQIGKYWKLYT